MDLVPLDLGRRCVPYAEAWQTQREVHAAVADGRRPDTVLLVEHESVYTAGRRTAARDRPVDGTPVVDVDRGGRITWHGPGQLVVYPIIRLAQTIGVRVAKGVTMHGLALNCDADLSAFATIVPCGLPDADVTSLSSELGRPVSIAVVTPLLCRHLELALAPVRAATQAAA